MNIIKILIKIVQRTVIVLLAVILLGNLYILAAKNFLKHPTLFGFSSAMVLTGSMEPAISANDMIVTQKKTAYEVGDIIMFESGNILVTHRIAEKTEDSFITKGDANNVEDASPVKAEQIVGKVILIIPKAALVLEAMKTPFGLMCLILAGFLLIEIPYLVEKPKKKEKGCE